MSIDLLLKRPWANVDLYMFRPVAGIDSIYGRKVSVAPTSPASLVMQYGIVDNTYGIRNHYPDGDFEVGQQFTASLNFNLDTVGAHIARTGTVGSSCRVLFYESNISNKPGTLLASSNQYTCASIDTTASWYSSFTFSPAITVASGNSYCVTVGGNWGRSTTNYLLNHGKVFGDHAGAAIYVQGGVATQAEATLTRDTSNDVAFRLYGPAFEDFTAYTEDDTGGYLTVTSNEIAWAALPWNVDSKVFYDFGANYFSGDFAIRFEFQMDVDNTSYMSPFIVANAAEGSGYWNSNQPCFRLYWSGVTVGLWGETRTSGGNETDNAGGMSLGTRYYITVTRDDDAGTYGNGLITTTIRTGSHKGTIFDTVIVNPFDKVDFRYLLPMTSHSAGGAPTSSGSVFNYEIVSVA